MKHLKSIKFLAIAFALTFVFAITLSACGGKGNKESESTEEVQSADSTATESEHPSEESEHPSEDHEHPTGDHEHPSGDDEGDSE